MCQGAHCASCCWFTFVAGAQVWDYDRVGDDDLVSIATLDSLDVRRRCLLPDRKPQKLLLSCRPGASKKEVR